MAMRSPGSASEKRALQIIVAIASLVPILAGASGVLYGPVLVGDVGGSHDLDSHFRYLSGLLLGIGLAYASAVPGIDRRRQRFLLLGSIVVLGGLGRLISLLLTGAASPIMLAALAMELVVTPVITFWQLRLSR
jgi:hypothetical protein